MHRIISHSPPLFTAAPSERCGGRRVRKGGAVEREKMGGEQDMIILVAPCKGIVRGTQLIPMESYKYIQYIK